jgi:hypothetical protein
LLQGGSLPVKPKRKGIDCHGNVLPLWDPLK